MAQRREFRPRPMLDALLAREVDFVVVGGIAGTLRGSSYPSYDLDIAYGRSRDNLERLAAALVDLEATLRGAPPDIPFLLDAKTLEEGAHFTFETPYGPLDILSDPDGAPRYAELKRGAGEPLELEGAKLFVASLDHLIAMKDASGRTKDKLMAMEYRTLADEIRERGRAGGPSHRDDGAT